MWCQDKKGWDLVYHRRSWVSWEKKKPLSVGSLIYPSTPVDAFFFTSSCQGPLWTNRGRFSQRLRPRYLDCWLGSRLQAVEGASQESRFFSGLSPSFTIFLNTNCRLGPYQSFSDLRWPQCYSKTNGVFRQMLTPKKEIFTVVVRWG